MKPSLFSITRGELEEALGSLGEPAYRAGQILSQFYRFAPSWESMTSLPLPLRRRLRDVVSYPMVQVERVVQDRSGSTEKFVLRLADGARVEAVILRNRTRPPTLCVSSQVGCPLACRFCATGLAGYTRNLEFDELVGQVWLLMGRLRREEPVEANPNVVFMGMGEPFLNRENLFRALLALVDSTKIGLGDRRVTISTIGIPRGIEELSRLGLKVNLALSLHHADDRSRKELLPGAPASLELVMEALSVYATSTRRLVTFEYVLLSGVNDSPRDASTLVQLIREFGHPALVNLLSYNPVARSGFRAPPPAHLARFLALLRRQGIRTTVRRSQGSDIGAACGQLASSQTLLEKRHGSPVR